MLKNIQQFFVSPVFSGNEDKTHLAEVLYALLANMLGALALLAIATVFVFVEKTGASILILVLFVWTLISYIQAKRGCIRFASIWFVIGTWLVFTLSLVLIGELNSTAATLYVALIVITGTLLGKRAAIIIAVLSSSIGLGMVILEQAGYSLAHYFVMKPISSWVILTIAFIWTLIPLNLNFQNFSKALVRARKSERRYETLFNRAPMKYLIIHNINGLPTIADCNEAFIEILGYPREQVIDQPLARFYAHLPDARQTAQTDFHQALQNKITAPIEREFVAYDGSLIYALYRGVPELDEAGKSIGVLAMYTDITARKHAEIALRARDEQLRHTGYWEVDLSTGNWKVSDGMYTLLENTPSKGPLTSSRLLEYIPSEDHASFIDAFNQAIQNKIPFRGIHHLVMPDGQTKWVSTISNTDYDAQGQAIRVTGISYNITELKQAEEQLRLQSAALEAVLNGVMIIDHSGLIQWVNPAFTKITGYSFAEAVGNTPRLLKSGEQTPDFYKNLWGMITVGQTWHGEIIDRHKDGYEVSIEQFIAPVRDAQNVVTHFVVSMIDISERIQKQQQLRLQSAALEAAGNAIVIADLNGHIEWINPEYTRLTGYTYEESIGMYVSLPKSDVYSAAFYENMWQTINDGNIWHKEMINYRKNGELYHEEMTITPVVNDQSEITHFITIKQDISERFKAETELRQYAEEQAALFAVAAATASQLDPAELFATTLDTVLAIPHLQADCGWVLLFDDLSVADKSGYRIAFGMFRNTAKVFLEMEIENDTSLCLLCIDALETPHTEEARIRQANECQCITKRVLRQENLQTHVGIPLKVDGHLLGVLNLGWRWPYHYDENYYSMLNSIGNQIGLALHRTRLYQEALQLNHLKIINQIGRDINASLELDTVARNMLNSIYRALNGQEGSILLIDSRTDDLRLQHTLSQLSERLRSKGIKKGQGIAGWVVENKQSALVNDPQHDPRWNAQFDVESGFHTTSILCAPLIHSGNVIGVIEIVNNLRGGFTSEDQFLMDAIAPIAAVAIKNAQLFTATLQRVEELDTINHIGNTMTSSLDSQVIISNALMRVRQQFNATYVGLLQEDKVSGELILKDTRFASPLVDARKLHFKPKPNFLVVKALNERRLILKADLMTDPETPEEMRVLINNRAHALMIVPMIVADRAIGAIEVASDQPGAYDENDLHVLQSIAITMSVALENARLYEDLKQLLKERERAQAHLIQSEKTSALGRLAATVAHEINNPLQAIQGCLELFGEEMNLKNRPEKLKRYLGTVESEITRIAAIVRRMRDFYRPAQDASLQPTNLHGVLQAVLDLSAKQIQQSSVKLEYSGSQNLPLVQANADHLKQVFLNLIINAVDAMPNGGTLRVGIETVELPNENNQMIEMLKVSFADSGHGIPPDVLVRLYEPSFTTKPNGTGLGLYISLNIVQAHNGKMEVFSQLDVGTTFEIFLPAIGINVL